MCRRPGSPTAPIVSNGMGSGVLYTISASPACALWARPQHLRSKYSALMQLYSVPTRRLFGMEPYNGS